MKRTVLADQIENAVDQFLSLEVADLAKRLRSAEMVVAIGVAARTLERAFASNLYRHGGCVARQDPPPRGHDPFHSPTIAGSGESRTGGVWRRAHRCVRREALDWQGET